MHTSKVEHRPSELLPLGICHDLVVHRVVIEVSFQTSGQGFVVCKTIDGFTKNTNAEIVLDGGFWPKKCVADIGVIKVVEGGHPVAFLDETG